MTGSEERDAIDARRALLRQQLEFLGEELPWLSDPDQIPATAIGTPPEGSAVHLASFSLATWVLLEVVEAADRVRHKLRWQDAIDGFHVAPHLEERVLRAVLEPASRHAPGIFAMSEIVTTVPVIATRASVPRSQWAELASRAEKFAARLSRDGTYVQVLVRTYLSEQEDSRTRGFRSLDPSLLGLDDRTGLSSITAIDELISSAAVAVARHIGPTQGTCVALQAMAPACLDHPSQQSMFSAIWSAYVAAAERLIYPLFDPDSAVIQPQSRPDPNFARALDSLAQKQANDLRSRAASKPSPVANKVIGDLLLDTSRQGR